MTFFDRFAFVSSLVMACTLACSSPAPPTCDAPGEACCDGACSGGLVCNSGTCARVHVVPDAGPCGDLGEGCCTALRCNSGLFCMSDVCVDQFGQSCAKNSDCLSALCLPVDGGPTGNSCTIICTGAADCRAGWSCAAFTGVPSTICQCHVAAEICNGLDDDCDGVIDGPPAAAWCASMDAGSSCAQSACAP